MDGVSVRVDGKQAAIYFVSADQLNLQVPDGANEGTVLIDVVTPTGSTQTTAQVAKIAPGLFSTAQVGDKAYVAAVHATNDPDGKTSYVCRPEILKTILCRPAKSGDVVLMFGTGFGPTEPRRESGRVIELAQLLSSFSVTIGGIAATATFGGLSSAGLYQFNVRIPDLQNGDHAVVIEIQDQHTQPNIIIPIANE